MISEPQTTERAATDLREWEAACEKLHQMGHAVDRAKIPFFEVRDWDAEDVMQVWAGKYTRNIALHYHDILRDPHIGCLKQILGGRPAAIVGAGPSLDKNVECLRDFPGLVIACDRAARCLTGRGIRVDIVVCVDPRQVVMAEMLDYRENAGQVLALSVCCAPEVARVWRGRRLYFSTIHEGTQFHDRILPELFPGMPGIFATGNVGNTAVQVAAWMAAGRIVLVGQDYGYTGNRMHADAFDQDRTTGAWSRRPSEPDSAALELRTGKVVVEGILTYTAFVEYRSTLRQIVDVMGLDLVNATEGGILNEFPSAKLADEVAALLAAGVNVRGEARALLAKATGGAP